MLLTFSARPDAASAQPVKRMPEQKNIPYRDTAATDFHPQKHLLDLYWPAVRENCPVLVFIHGGTWISGSKDLYIELGKNFAAKGVTTAVINYRLGDVASYNQMAADCAAAVKWIHEHAKQYHGNPDRVSVMGHSAGGHLAALITLDPDYFKALHTPNPIKGCLLIDAFGLNIDTFIQSPLAYMYRSSVARVFTSDPVQWKKASPVNHVEQNKVPFYIVTGTNSYPFLVQDNMLFTDRLRMVNKQVVYETMPGKNHQEMVTQFAHPGNVLYEKIPGFIRDYIP